MVKKEDEEEYEIDITINSNYEEVSKFLREKLHVSQDIIEDLGLNGEILFNLECEDIDNLIDKQNTKVIKNLKKFIEKRKNISNDSNNQLEKNENKNDQISINKELDEFSIFIEEKENINIEEENKNNKKEYNIQPLNDKSKYNVFIIICLRKNDFNNIKISFSSLNFNKTYNDLKSRILYVSNNYIFDKNPSELFLIQIELCDNMDYLDITIMKNNKKTSRTINIKDINNYFFFDNFFENNDILYKVSKDNIFEEFFNYFFDKKSNYEKEFKKDLMSSLIRCESEIILSGNNILRIFKFCSKYELKMNKIIKYIKFEVKTNSFIEQENILLYSEIDNFLSNSIMIKLITNIYIKQLKEKEIFNEIINKSKYKIEFSKAILSLLKDKKITPKDLFFLQKFNLEKTIFFIRTNFQ